MTGPVERVAYASYIAATTAVLAALLLSGSSAAQDEPAAWTWPEKPQNLQVLPKDWPGARLRAPMRGFARALGVSCAHCHVGEDGEPLSTYDFASDENPNKERAREMLRMLGTVNDHLDRIEPSGDRRVNMWCHTCHRGRPRPMTLGEELGEVYRRDGLDAALAHYSDLEERFTARGAYDFSEGGLNGFGYQLLRADDAKAAVAVFRLNSQLFPESANVWDSLAEGLERAGDTAGAIGNYEKSLALDPANENAREHLRRLREKGEN